jgi:hypothetical protein
VDESRIVRIIDLTPGGAVDPDMDIAQYAYAKIWPAGPEIPRGGRKRRHAAGRGAANETAPRYRLKWIIHVSDYTLL